MNCEYCQPPVHIWFQCPKKPDGWKPARLAKTSSVGNNVATPPLPRKQVPSAGAKSTAARKDVPVSKAPEEAILDRTTLAGTQALPVDTNPSGTTRSRSSTGQSLGVAGSKPAASEPEGHPKFNKKAWMREYMREYRKGIKRREDRRD